MAETARSPAEAATRHYRERVWRCACGLVCSYREEQCPKCKRLAERKGTDA